MGLFDSDGFGTIKNEPKKSSFGFDMGINVKTGRSTDTPSVVGNDFDKTLVGKINPLVKMDVINDNFSLSKLLREYGCYLEGSTMYCPFHDDDVTGKPSAKFHHHTDTLYCFSESKVYTAYHALKILYGKNVNQLFNQIWHTLSKDDRLRYLSKYDESVEEVRISDTEWEYYNKNVLSSFKEGKVSFGEYKRALYKILNILQK